jgi:hypothetical protein
LIAAVASGGVPHPPGYPLYALLTAPFTWLPMHSVAWRVNLAAAVFAMIAAAGIAWAVTRITARWWCGIAAAGLFAFGPAVWTYATTAEVFSLNNALIALQLGLFAAVDRQPRARLVYAGAFVTGLGVSNHHTSVVFTAVLLLGMLWRTRTTWRDARAIGMLAAGAAAGLLPYLYLPLASMHHAAVSWGDTATLHGFIDHFLRRDYGTFRLAADTQHARLSTMAQLGYYGRDLIRQITWVGIALAVWGLASTLRRRETRLFGATTFAAYAAFLLVFHSLANLRLDEPLIHNVVARFWQAPNLVVCLWAGIGIAALSASPTRSQAALALTIALMPAVLHAREARLRQGNRMVHEYGAAMLQAAPPNALILTRGVLITNVTRYFNVAENVRSDVRILDLEMLTFPWMTRQIQRNMSDVMIPGVRYGVDGNGAYDVSQLITANAGRRPVMLCGTWKPGDASVSAYRTLPLGLCDLIVPAADSIDVARWSTANAAAMPQFGSDMRVIPGDDSWERVVWNDYWEARHSRAYTYLTLALERHDDPALLRSAAESFDTIIPLHPAAPAAWYKNLAIARTRLAATDGTSVPLAIAAITDYLRHAPASDPERPAFMQALHQLGGSYPQ